MISSPMQHRHSLSERFVDERPRGRDFQRRHDNLQPQHILDAKSAGMFGKVDDVEQAVDQIAVGHTGNVNRRNRTIFDKTRPFALFGERVPCCHTHDGYFPRFAQSRTVRRGIVNQRSLMPPFCNPVNFYKPTISFDKTVGCNVAFYSINPSATVARPRRHVAAAGPASSRGAGLLFAGAAA